VAEFQGISKLLFGDDEKDKAHSFGEDIAAALVTGIMEGLGTAISLQGKLLKGIFFEGPLSLVGRINGILGIHSPSTVMMTVGQNLILGLISGLSAGLRSLGAAAVTVGTNAVISVRNGIIGQLRGLGNTALSIRNTVIQTLANSGTWLYNIGRNVVYGLYNGIVSLGSWLYNRILAFIRATVPAPIRFALGISSPSKVTAELGRFVAQGLAVGMEDGTKGVAAAASGLADAAVPVIGPQLNTNLAAAARAGQAPPPALELGWRPGSSGDKILDGIRDNISIKWRGDPVAALARRGDARWRTSPTMTSK
jgi:phage-related protein